MIVSVMKRSEAQVKLIDESKTELQNCGFCCCFLFGLEFLI